MEIYTQYFNSFKDASGHARNLSRGSGRSLKVNRHGGGFNVHIPQILRRRSDDLLAIAAEKLFSQRVNVGAFSAGVLMLFHQGQAGALIAEDSLVIEAFRRSDSSLSDASVSEISDYLSEYSSEQQAGIINNVKGIYHELAFVEAENSDMDAWTAAIMPSTNHPGVDVVMSNSVTGEITELQLKATDSVSYASSAVEQHPNVGVIGTSEVAFGNPDITDSGFSNESLTEDVTSAAEALQGVGGEELIGEMVGDALTGGAFTGVIAAAGALNSDRNSEDIAADIGKAVLRGTLLVFGLSFF